MSELIPSGIITTWPYQFNTVRETSRQTSLGFEQNRFRQLPRIATERPVAPVITSHLGLPVAQPISAVDAAGEDVCTMCCSNLFVPSLFRPL